jgi:outer membrane protein assembly factor BamB
VRSSSRPTNLNERGDYDFVGSPVALTRPGCGELVAGLNKNGRLYLWHSGALPDGPVSSVRVSAADVRNPVLTNPAYSPRTRSLYVVTHLGLVRLAVTRRCTLRLAWTRRVGDGLANSSPTVAGGTVWFVVNGDRPRLLALDARSGTTIAAARVAGPVFAAPAVVGRSLVVAAFPGSITLFRLA